MSAENTEQAMTPASYIGHHLTFLKKPVGDGGFLTLHVDTLVTSAILGIVVFGFIWWVVRGATAGVPNKRQAFVELCVEFVNEQVKSIFHNDIKFVAPLALTVFMWVLFMNAMDFLPVDIMAAGLNAVGIHEFRLVPTADVNATFALALSVWVLMIFFAIKVKGIGGFIHELFFAPFGAPKLTLNPLSWILLPLAMAANFLMQMIEYISQAAVALVCACSATCTRARSSSCCCGCGPRPAWSAPLRQHLARRRLGDLPHPDRRPAGLHLHDADHRLHLDGARASLTSS